MDTQTTQDNDSNVSNHSSVFIKGDQIDPHAHIIQNYEKRLFLSTNKLSDSD